VYIDDVRLNCGTDRDDGQQEHGTSGSGDGTAGGPDCEWKEHMRYFRHNMWSSGHPWYYLEAVGWVCDCTYVAKTNTRTIHISILSVITQV